MRRRHQEKHKHEHEDDVEQKPRKVGERRVAQREQMAVPAEDGRQERGDERKHLIELSRTGQRAVLHPLHFRQRRGEADGDGDREQAPDQVGAGLSAGEGEGGGGGGHWECLVSASFRHARA
jgi:hypothetical protein